MENESDLGNVWYNAFNIIDIVSKEGNIEERLSEALKMISTFTLASDVQIYKKSKCYYNIECYAGLHEKKELSDFYRDGKLLLDYEPIKVETNDNIYLVILKNNDIVDEELNIKYKSVIKRTFEIIFRVIEDREKIIMASKTDALTNVGNKYSYDQYVDELSETDNLITYTLVDLFRLKYVNDHHGHAAGDRYIITTAKLIENVLDDDDKLFRIGGDEFVILSNGFKHDEIKNKLERVNMILSCEMLEYNLPFPLCANYGIVEQINDFKLANIEADVALSKHKIETYERLHIKRRQ